MKQLFSYENPVTQFLMKFCSACCLGLLWTICSLPVFTMGAATTALYTVTLRLVRDREGYDALSQSGYLADLSPLIPEDSPLAPRLVSNLVILEDNAREHALDESVPYRAETTEAVNGLDCTDAPLFQRAGMDDAVYLAVIANSPRAAQALDYCAGLCAAGL